MILRDPTLAALPSTSSISTVKHHDLVLDGKRCEGGLSAGDSLIVGSDTKKKDGKTENPSRSVCSHRTFLYIILGSMITIISLYILYNQFIQDLNSNGLNFKSVKPLFSSTVGATIEPTRTTTTIDPAGGNNIQINDQVNDTSVDVRIKKKRKKKTIQRSLQELVGLYKPKGGIAKYVKPLEPKTRLLGRREM